MADGLPVGMGRREEYAEATRQAIVGAARRRCLGHARSFVSAHINACVLTMTEKAADLIQATARARVAAADRY